MIENQTFDREKIEFNKDGTRCEKPKPEEGGELDESFDSQP